jgi:hypothetical protein
MQQQSTTELVRIDKDLLDKIRYVSKAKGQTITGYVNVNIKKQVERDWSKFAQREKNCI